MPVDKASFNPLSAMNTLIHLFSCFGPTSTLQDHMCRMYSPFPLPSAAVIVLSRGANSTLLSGVFQHAWRFLQPPVLSQGPLAINPILLRVYSFEKQTPKTGTICNPPGV